MKRTTIKAIVVKDFNDGSENNKRYDINDIIENMPYGKFERLRSMGFVEEYKPEEETKIESNFTNENKDTNE